MNAVIDDEARKHLARLARRLASGSITNEEFENRQRQSKEPALHDIYFYGLWPLYDDFVEHKLVGRWALTREGRAWVARIVLFLHSGLPYRYPRVTGLSQVPVMLLSLVTLGWSDGTGGNVTGEMETKRFGHSSVEASTRPLYRIHHSLVVAPNTALQRTPKIPAPLKANVSALLNAKIRTALRFVLHYRNRSSQSKEASMKVLTSLLLALAAFTVTAQNYPAPQEGTWVVRDFKFHTGETLPELKLHYRTVGDKSGRAGDHHAWHHRIGRGIPDADVRGGVVRAGAAARCEALLHHPAGRGRPRALEQAVRRPEDEVSALQL